MALWATWRAGAPTRKSGGTGDAPPPPATGLRKNYRHIAIDWLKHETPPPRKPYFGEYAIASISTFTSIIIRASVHERAGLLPGNCSR